MSSQDALIRLRGIRQNNLKNFDLDIPIGKMTVVTGLSGSGKSSLVFDTLYAEGQRRYVETFSPYARQFMERLDRPKADSIEGIPPAIAIQQGNTVKTSRSTVGTLTELCDYFKLLMSHRARLICPNCHQEVAEDTPESIFNHFLDTSSKNGKELQLLVTFPITISAKVKFKELAAILLQQGYRRWWDGKEVKALDASDEVKHLPSEILIVQDRFLASKMQKSRFIEAAEAAFRIGKGKLSIIQLSDQKEHKFSRARHCARCNRSFIDPSPSLFSFNTPLGACPKCRGFGRTIEIDLGLVIPDHSLSLKKGAIKPWLTGESVECQEDLLAYCKRRKIPLDIPFSKLSAQHQKWVVEGDPEDPGNTGYGPWYGVKGFFNWLESKSYKMHVRVLLSRYRTYRICDSCGGGRFQPETLYYQLEGKTLAELYRVQIGDLRSFLTRLNAEKAKREADKDPTDLILREIISRLTLLGEVGLDYLTLDRTARTLSGGEVQRVNLTTCLGSAVVNTLFILDEPSVGLHPRDVTNLIHVLEALRDRGNTLVIVEHEPSIIRAADYLVDLGPGAGENGGNLIVASWVSGSKFPKSNLHSLTLDYLSGSKQISLPKKRRPVNPSTSRLRIKNATENNLKDLSVEIPIGCFICITGVSGSGKSTLVHRVIYENLQYVLGKSKLKPGNCERISGIENIGSVILVDQAPIGRTSRSNPALYIGAWDFVREMLAALEQSQQRGYSAGTFSFNSGEGRCDRCGGNGYDRVEMQFLPDVLIECPQCHGQRFRSEVLEIELGGKNVADLLGSTITEIILHLKNLSTPGKTEIEQRRWERRRNEAITRLQLLERVGLGYLRLGQPINTLSGGEAQRLKLCGFLAESLSLKTQNAALSDVPSTLLIFDEPTTGLHFDDVRQLLEVFQQLVDQGHSVLVIEHNLEVVKCCDWIIDLGPEAGDRGGNVVTCGTPENVAQHSTSYTGKYLRSMLNVRRSLGVIKINGKEEEKELRVPRSAFRNSLIQITRAREHNLKNISLSIPRDQLVVITGLSGSGKSTLAFDLVFEEGQRRFLDCMSTYARQYVDQMPRPDVDLIEGIPPTVAIEQRISRGGWKSTVATITEAYHFIRLLYAKVGVQHCPQCQCAIQEQTEDAAVQQILSELRKRPLHLLAPLIRGRKGFHQKIVEWAATQGFKRLRVDGRMMEIDRLRGSKQLARYVEHTIELDCGLFEKGGKDKAAIQRALRLGQGMVVLLDPHQNSSPASVGGHGLLAVEESEVSRQSSLERTKVDWSFGVVSPKPKVPWAPVHGAPREIVISTSQMCPQCGRSFAPLDPKDFSFNSPSGWCPHCRGYGVVWEDESFEDEDREKEMAHEQRIERRNLDEEAILCAACEGARLKTDSLFVKVGGLNLSDLNRMSAKDASLWFKSLKFESREKQLASDIIPQITDRLKFMNEVGLHYLGLGRAAVTLSGGEAQRIRLASQLGSNLRGVLYVLDEPTIGLHPRDNEKLLQIMDRLKRRGNSLLVVEHDEETMRRADWLIDLGPGAGKHGGEVVWMGTPGKAGGRRKKEESSERGTRNAESKENEECGRQKAEKKSWTLDFLDNPMRHPMKGSRRDLKKVEWLTIKGATLHNLKKVTASFPISRLTAVTGVSGAGKSSLVRGTLLDALKNPKSRWKNILTGQELVRAAYEVDQAPIGKTPRSCPATYLHILDEIRRLFAGIPEARVRGYTASRFSFNVAGGRCEKCEGQGRIKLQMNFLPDAYVPCDICGGNRFNSETLEIRFHDRTIAEVLTMSAEEALEFFSFDHKISHPLKLLVETGLSYLSLGQSSPTLSGGEAQRMKLVSELMRGQGSPLQLFKSSQTKNNLYVLEEPTIGLHFSDIEKLIGVLHRLVDMGHTVIVVEHNLDLIAEADYVIDLGPEGGDEGGRIIASGSPEEIALHRTSHTAKFIQVVLKRSKL